MATLSSIRGFGSGTGKLNQQEFLSSGTWVRPAGVNIIYVTAVGGGGGNAHNGIYWPSGGGGGIIYKVPMTVFGNISVTIGAGGAGVYANVYPTVLYAASGGNTVVGSYIAYGGGGASSTQNGYGMGGSTNITSATSYDGGVYSAINNMIFGCFRGKTDTGGYNGSKLIDSKNGTYFTAGGISGSVVPNSGNGGSGTGGISGSSGYALIEWFT